MESRLCSFSGLTMIWSTTHYKTRLIFWSGPNMVTVQFYLIVIPALPQKCSELGLPFLISKLKVLGFGWNKEFNSLRWQSIWLYWTSAYQMWPEGEAMWQVPETMVFGGSWLYTQSFLYNFTKNLPNNSCNWLLTIMGHCDSLWTILNIWRGIALAI